MNWPLMANNITEDDRGALISFLLKDARLTHGSQVEAFEAEFARWLGVKHAVMVNSGASANHLTMAALRDLHGPGEVLLPPITWSSDVSAVLRNGLTPVFVDVDPFTLGMDCDRAIDALTDKTRAVFITHCLGYNALRLPLMEECANRDILLIEDTCESLGATWAGRKLGTLGRASNFSFYYAHHMTTIEGGMICTNDEAMYETCRMLRSHGLTREIASPVLREAFRMGNPNLDQNFIFAHAGFNCRPTELNAVLGREQLKRLDAGNARRSENELMWLATLDPAKYRTGYRVEGSCNYALVLVLARPDPGLMERVLAHLRAKDIEYRRGTAGGGNQLRQPYLRAIYGDKFCEGFPEAEWIHFFGLYIGNYPSLDPARVDELAKELNAL